MISVLQRELGYIYKRWNKLYIIFFLIEITMPELLDALAEANAVNAVDIYEYLYPELIDKITDTSGEFIDAVKQIKE